MPEPAGALPPGPTADPAPSMAELIRMVSPTVAPIAAGGDTLGEINNPGVNVRPTAATAPGSTVESITSTVLQSVFGSVPLVGAIEGAHSGSSSGVGGTVESIASTVLKSGLGLVPLIGGLLGLFGGGDSPAPAPLGKYALPASLRFE